MMKKNLFIFFLTTLCVSCTDSAVTGIFRGTSERANTRFAQSMTHNEARGYAVIPTTNRYIIYACGDTHVQAPSKSFTRFVMDYKSDPNCPFAIHVGDVVNANNQFPIFFSQAAQQPQGYVPGSDTIFYALGNHDIYYGQWDTYRQYNPSTSYYFSTQTAQGQPLDLFICIDTAEGTLGTDALAWLKALLQKVQSESWRHIVVFTHTNFFRHDRSQEFTSNLTMEETYDLTNLFKQTGVQLVISGHDHYREVIDYSGVYYVTLDALQDDFAASSYLKITMDEHIIFDWIPVEFSNN